MATNSNLVENILDTQKKVLDNVVESTKKFTAGNNPLTETIEKGNEWYKNWLDTQKNFFTKATGAATSTENGKTKTDGAKAKETTAAGNEFLENWLNTQATWAKQIWEMSQESAKKFGAGAHTNPFTNISGANNNPFAAWMGANNNPFAAWTGAANPFANWQNSLNNFSNPFTDMMNQMNANNWMNQMQQINPLNNDAFKKSTESMTDMFTNYYKTLTSTFTDFQKNFENGTAQDAYKNMINSAEGFTKFAEMWMPMIKSMQDKTFSMDEYKKLMNPETYKEFMDKFFGFMPESGREYMNKMSGMMTEGMKKMTDSGMSGYHQMRDMMSKFGNTQNPLNNIYNEYTKWQNQVNEAVAPFTKLMPPNQYTKTMQDWNDISNKIMEYNMKNAELQFMVYNQGAKVMDKLAEHTAHKMKEGKEVTSIIDLYQDWMNISDKVFVSLFESTEYSKLMAEVSALQNKIRKDTDTQTEKMLKDIPVATRSELDEVYKTIYELKKKVHQLEKMLDIDGGIEVEEEVKPTAKHAAPKSAAKKK